MKLLEALLIGTPYIDPARYSALSAAIAMYNVDLIESTEGVDYQSFCAGMEYALLAVMEHGAPDDLRKLFDQDAEDFVEHLANCPECKAEQEMNDDTPPVV